MSTRIQTPTSFTQPQLMHIALNENDVVYTPDDVARDVVAFFKPSGKILEPCCGEGAFLKYLPPDTEWCEIEKGRDFFANHNHYDWIIGNPPYSSITQWLEHGFNISENVVFILHLAPIISSIARLRLIREYGGIVTYFVLGDRTRIPEWDSGYVVGAIHFQRGYTGGMFTVFRE